MKALKTSIVATCFMLLCLAFAPVKRSQPSTDGQFLKALLLIEKSRKALENDEYKQAYKLAQKALKECPHNRVIFDEAWKVHLLNGKYKQAKRISENYMDYLNDMRRDDNLEHDFLFSKYRFYMSEAIVLLHSKKLHNANFGAIKAKLKTIQHVNRNNCFLSVSDLAELNNLMGLLSIVADGKSRHFKGDTWHSHLNANEIQGAYNYFNMADSLNQIFELKYEALDTNLNQCILWNNNYFLRPIEKRYKIDIPILHESLCIGQEVEPEVLLVESNAKDSLLKAYTKPQAYLQCFSEAHSALARFEEFHFFFDHSGSMGTISSEEGPLAQMTRLQVMKKSAAYIMLSLVEGGKLDMNAISVGDYCTNTPSLNTYVEPDRFEKPEDRVFHILNWLEQIHAEGATPLYNTFDMVNNHVQPTKKKSALILFSDGINSCDVLDGDKTDNDRLLQLKNELDKKNIEVFVVSLLPEEGNDEAFGIYKELARGGGDIWSFTNDCKKVELENNAFKLNFFLPPFESCATHTLNSDSVCFDWVDLDCCFDIQFEASAEDE